MRDGPTRIHSQHAHCSLGNILQQVLWDCCLSNNSKGHAKPDLVVQLYQLHSRFKLYQSLVTSILLIGYETWTLLAHSKKRIQAFETKCMRKLLCISYLEHKTNKWVRREINFLVGPQEPLLAPV